MESNQEQGIIAKIQLAFEAAFADVHFDNLKIAKNIRRSVKINYWDVSADFPNAYSGAAPAGLKHIDIYLKRDQPMELSGISCIVVLSDGRELKFDFYNDAGDPMAAMSGPKIMASIFFWRNREGEDNVRYSIDIEILGHPIPELLASKRDAFVSALESSRAANMTRPGELESEDVSAEDRSMLVDMTQEALNVAQSGFEAMKAFMQRLG